MLESWKRSRKYLCFCFEAMSLKKCIWGELKKPWSPPGCLQGIYDGGFEKACRAPKALVTCLFAVSVFWVN